MPRPVPSRPDGAEPEPEPEPETIRPLPRNREAEQVILGAALLDADEVVPQLLERLKEEHFYWRAHRLIYRTVLELFEKGVPADLITVSDRLEELEALDEVGGRAYLSELTGRVTTTTSVPYYAEIVKKKAVMRELIEAGREITELGFREAEELPALLDRAEVRIFSLSRHGMRQSYYHLRDFLHEHISNLERLHREPDKRTVTGISTGFRELDELTSGLQPSDMIVIAGRPGMGKSSFALSLARHAAIQQGVAVGMFSLEMSKEQLLERLLCGEARVNLHRLRGGYLESEAWRRIAEAAGRLVGSTLLIDDEPGISVMELKAKARRMQAEHGLDLLIVDYLQLVEAGSGSSSQVREQEVAYISRSLKGLARELNIPVVALSQLSRAPERERGRARRPRLSDLRESGSIEQEADVVVFIYREDYYAEGEEAPPSDAPEGPNISTTEIIIGKQRNGPLGSFKLAFHRSYASFYDVAPQRSPF